MEKKRMEKKRMEILDAAKGEEEELFSDIGISTQLRVILCIKGLWEEL